MFVYNEMSQHLIADRGNTRYTPQDIAYLRELQTLLAPREGKCLCCQKRVCWKQIETLERAREFVLSHVPHKDESARVISAWTNLAHRVARRNKSLQ